MELGNGNIVEESNQSRLWRILDWVYEKAVDGIPSLDSAYELAADYLKGGDSLEDQVNSLIRWQNTKAGTSGFFAGVGGPLSTPAIPANIASVLFIQIRMIAAIAHMGGHDIRHDRVRTFVYVCLTGNAAKDILKNAGIKIVGKLTKKVIEKIPVKLIIEINKAVGFRLLTKFGEKGIVNLHKAIPLASGVVGAVVDASATNVIGNTARKMFISDARKNSEVVLC